jgi:hypothetical protein
MKFTEAQLKAAIIELLGAEGTPHVLGEAIERSPTPLSDLPSLFPSFIK